MSRKQVVKRGDNFPTTAGEQQTAVEQNKAEVARRLMRMLVAEKDEAKRNQILDKLSPEAIKELRTIGNPLEKPVVFKSDEFIAMHYIDVDKKYKEQFLTTALIGFLYRMLDEYDPPHINADLISEDSPQFANAVNAKVIQLRANKPVMLLQAELYNERNKPQEEWDVLEIYRLELGVARAKKNMVRGDIRKKLAARDELKVRITNARDAVTSTEMMITERKNNIAAVKRYLETGEMGDLKPAEANTPVSKLQAVLDVKCEELVKLQQALSDLEVTLAEYTNDLEALQAKEAQHKADIVNIKVRFTKDPVVAKILTDRSFTPLTLQLNDTWKGFAIDTSKVDISDQDYRNIIAEVKEELQITTTKEEKRDKFLDRVAAFLDSIFRYNPDNHVVCAYTPSYDRMKRIPVRTQQDRVAWEDRVRALREEAEVKFSRSVIPPKDTFFRFNRYMENNYEALRQATDDIYDTPAGFEHAFAPLATFKGDPEKVDADFTKFKQKYSNEFDLDVFLLRLGNWTLVDSWEANRDRIDYYTEKTEIVKKIVERSKDDARKGKDLMEKRIKKGGVKDESLDQYLAAKGSKLEKYGAKRVTADDTADASGQAAGQAAGKAAGQTSSQTDGDVVDPSKFLVNDSRIANDKNEIEMAIHHMAPVRYGARRFRAKMEQFNVNLGGNEEGEVSADIKSAAGYKKEKALKKAGKQKQKQ